MPITMRDQKSYATIRHNTSLTATEVNEFKTVLYDHLSRFNDITINFENLEDCDTLGVQLLLSAAKSAEKENRILKMTGAVEALIQASERAGINFDDYFECQLGESPSCEAITTEKE